MAAISVSALSKEYSKGVKALDSVSLDVPEGAAFALLGPNGAGKTTLMRILTTQIPSTSGTARVMGNDVAKQGSAVRGVVSYVPQEMSVWGDISGYENMLIYAKIYAIPDMKRKIEESLELMELTESAHHLVNTYSGGMVRKLEIACAVMSSPSVLFLDEPTIGLDPGSRKTVWEKIRSLCKESGTTVFFSTHYMDEAGAYADEIGIINRGRIVKVGSPDELKHTIGTSSLAIACSRPASKQEMAAIRKIKGVHDASLDNSTVRITLAAKGAKLDSLLKLFARNEFGVKEITSSEPSIDDVFLKYAGAGEAKASRFSEIKRTRDRIRRS